MKKYTGWIVLAVLAVAATGAKADIMPLDILESGPMTVSTTDGSLNSSVNLVLSQDVDLVELSMSTLSENSVNTDLMSVWDSLGLDFKAPDNLFLQGDENGALSMNISSDPFAVSIYDVGYTSAYLPTDGTIDEIGGLAPIKLDSSFGGLQAIPEPTVLALCSVFGGGFIVVRRLFKA